MKTPVAWVTLVMLLPLLLLQSAQAWDKRIILSDELRGGGLGGGNNKKRGADPPASKAAAPKAETLTNGQQPQLVKSLAIAGKVGIVIEKLKKARLRPVLVGLHKAFNLHDIVWLGAMGWLAEPLTRQWYKIRKRYGPDTENYVEEYYKTTWTGKIANIVGQLGKVASFIYACDMASVVATRLGFRIPPLLNDRIARLAYTVWGFYRLRKVKSWWIRHVIFKEKEGELSVRAAMANRITDGIGYICLAFFVSDIFQVTLGSGLQSILAVGGLSTLLLSLASKDVAQLLVSGLVVNSSDKFLIGESVELGDGTSGKVVKLGLFEMQLRGGDGVVTRIPTAQVVNQRVKNISRTSESQVKQTLWFKYEDIDKIPTVLESIKTEIEKSCPELITDGSRPFRAVWTEFKNDHLEAMVQAHFNIKPGGDPYYQNRQQVLQSIARAARQNGVEFALPTSVVKSPAEENNV